MITGEAEILKNLDKAQVNISQAIDEAVVDVAHQVRSLAVKSIQEVSNGHTSVRYSQGGNPYNHVVSAAGDAPNTDTGKLASSIGVQHKKGSGEAYVSTDDKKAPHLEFGTINMEPRPFLGPALEQKEDLLPDAISNAVKRQLGKI